MLAKFYICDRGNKKIKRYNTDGSGVEIIASVDTAGEVSLDSISGKMYWTNYVANKIHRANFDGSNIEDLVTSGLNMPYAIRLDTVNNKLYWTEDLGHRIRRSNLDGSNVETIISSGTGTLWPIGLVVNTVDSKIYWTDNDYQNAHATPSVCRANLDGTNVEVLLTKASGISKPEGIGIDIVSGHLYFTDYGNSTIKRCNLDGSNLTTIVSSLTYPHGLSLDTEGGKIYWTDYLDGKVYKCNFDGSSKTTLVTGLSVGGIGPAGIDFTLGITEASGNHDIIIHGYEDFVASGDLYVYGYASGQVEISGNLFTKGIDDIQSSGDLFVGGVDGISDSINLYTYSLGTTVASGDLFIGGVFPATGMVPLFTNSHDILSDSGNLYIYHSENITESGLLVTLGHETCYSDLDLFTLFLKVPELSSGSLSLYLKVPEPCSKSGSLYITNYEILDISGTLFISGAITVPSGVEIRTINKLTKAADYDPQLMGSFTTSPSGVTIEVWDIVDGQNIEMVLGSSGCYAIGDTNTWGWSTEYLPMTQYHAKYHYYFMMTGNTGEKVFGEFFLVVPERGQWSYFDWS